jgi:hypothetical protein
VAGEELDSFPHSTPAKQRALRSAFQSGTTLVASRPKYLIVPKSSCQNFRGLPWKDALVVGLWLCMFEL